MTAPLTCSIIAMNYVAQARVLARSFSRHHEGSRLQVLVIDDLAGRLDPDAEPFDILRPSDLPLAEREFHDMAGCYDVLELATALKPTLLQELLERTGGSPVVYLDPDILVLAPFDELGTAREQPIVLTPHTAVPMPRDSMKPTEFDILASGTWNLGFLGVSAGAEDFLSWWAERLRFDSLVDHAGMRFTDQRWVDFAPAYFDVHALRDPTFNVAYWNADHRRVEWDGERYLVDGRPLRFFHFSGFDPLRPHILSKHQGDTPRVRLSEQPALSRLCVLYSELLYAEGLEVARQVPYGWATLPDGTEMTPSMRHCLRRALMAAEADRGEGPPDPFDPLSTGAFLRWLAEPDTANAEAPEIPRLFWEIHQQRPDLQRAFPLVGTISSAAYRTWAFDRGRHEESVPKDVVATVFGRGTWPKVTERTSWAAPTRLQPGFLVTGYLRAELGLGEAARRAVSTMSAAGLPFSCRSFGLTRSRQKHLAEADGPARVDLNTNVLWINPDQLGFFIRSAGRSFFEGRYTIGAWAWETLSLPPKLAELAAFVDEVWSPSEFCRRSIQTAIDKPVYAFPHPIAAPVVDPAARRSSLGLPEGYIFLFVFDFFSTIARKNPLGLIEAFSRAFEPDEGPSLVLKTINGAHAMLDVERVRLAAGGRRDIVIIDEYIPAERCAAMIAQADCYVSLHRAEGFGLTMADALALGIPVIATGYSGNLEFMDEDTAYLVPYELRTIGMDAYPYPESGVWAEPDLDVAADLLRRVYEHPDEARRMASEARRSVLTEHGHARAARFLTDRFEVIQEALRGGFESPVAAAVGAALAGGGA